LKGGKRNLNLREGRLWKNAVKGVAVEEKRPRGKRRRG